MAVDEALEDYQREYRYAQNEHDANSSTPLPKAGKIARFFRGQDCPDKYKCDIIYVDRTTGREVMRYDGADPANTNPYYGATTDKDCLARKGLDINEMIDPSQAVISNEELSRMCATYYDYE